MDQRTPPPARLGEENLATLRAWGQGLATVGRDQEMRAAGRAILLLADEIDALQRDLWNTRAGVSDELPSAEGEPPREEAARDSIAGALSRRLRAQPRGL